MRRRRFIVLVGSGVAGGIVPRRFAFALGEQERHFIAEAARMKSQAVASADQPFGAVLVRAVAIIGYGPSRVILDRNPNAHAERVALWDAQKRLGTDMTGAVIYSTSRPCSLCEHALAVANVERMYFGADGTDAGRPRRSS
jgi:tRNA(Arg) A34 adenosine deaminase TadA